MGQPAAKQNDKIEALDIHVVIGANGTPASLPHPFLGIITDSLSNNVRITSMFAATVDSTAQNTPFHVPAQPGSFQRPPSNQATIKVGSLTVRINGKAAARNGDIATTCNDPEDEPIGKVIAVGTVNIG